MFARLYVDKGVSKCAILTFNRTSVLCIICREITSFKKLSLSPFVSHCTSYRGIIDKRIRDRNCKFCLKSPLAQKPTGYAYVKKYTVPRMSVLESTWLGSKMLRQHQRFLLRIRGHALLRPSLWKRGVQLWKTRKFLSPENFPIFFLRYKAWGSRFLLAKFNCNLLDWKIVPSFIYSRLLIMIDVIFF